MRTYEMDWVDAFTTKAFGGNGCAVVHEADDISIEERLLFVRETQLVECAFLVSSDKADFGARYYLADREIPMAGHPTVATVTSLIHRGLVSLKNGRAIFTLEIGAGVIGIDVEETAGGPLITMAQPQPRFGAECPAADIAAIYGLEAGDIVGTPQVVSTGTPFCITVLKDHETLRRAKVDFNAFHAWRDTQPGEDAALMEPFLVTLEGIENGDTFSRLLLAPPNPPEDPFTGSATGCMGAYLWANGLIDDPIFVAEQGHWMGRPGSAVVEVNGPHDGITGVRVSGHGTVLMEGRLRLP